MPLPFFEYVDRWAIVVGISRYEHDSLSLKYADRDAEEFYGWLQTPSGGGYPADHIVRLVDQEATTASVTRALRSFLQKPAREDIVVIYFACHGKPDPQRPRNIYLLTHDTDPDDIAGTALPMREIDLALRENLLAERVVILADTCHSAAIGAGRRGVTDSAQVNRYLQELSQSKPGVALLTSAEANETALEGEEWGGGHGVFTHFLLEGLRGAADRSPANGTVTVGELFEFVRESVRDATGGSQHPTIGPNVFDRRLPMAVTGDVTAQERFELGTCLYEFGRRLRDPQLLDAALRRLREADRLMTERRPDVLTQLGKVLLARDRREEALRAFREAVELDHGYADARYYLSILEPATGKTFRARFPDDPRGAFVEQWAGDSRVRGANRAIVVGIDEYPQIPELSHHQAFLSGASKNDARKVAQVLQGLEFDDGHVDLLLDAEATKHEVLGRLGSLARETDGTRTFLFYYSGVGFEKGVPGLLLYDSAMDPGRTETLLTAHELHDAVSRVPAMHRVVILDGSVDEAMEWLAPGGGYVVFSATSPGERAYVAGGHGAFTRALVEELEDIASPAGSCEGLRARVVERMAQTTQRPVVWGDPTRPLVEPRSRVELALEVAEAGHYGRYSSWTLEDLLGWARGEGLALPEMALGLGRAFLEKRDHQRAIEALGMVSAASGAQYTEALLLSALAHLSSGDTEAGIAELERLVAPEIDCPPRLYQEVASLLLALGRHELAIMACRRSMDGRSEARSDTQAVLGLAQALAGDEAAETTLTSYWKSRSESDHESGLNRIARFLATGEVSASSGVLVGISAYPEYSLEEARAEAERLRDVLIERYGFLPDEMVLLLDQDATRENIVRALEEAATHVHGSFLFFFSGHCSASLEGEGAEKPDIYADIYVPVDGVPGLEPDRVISGSQLHQLISQIPARDKTVILDAGGPQVMALATASGEYLLLTSAAPGHTTFDGAFSTLLIEELRQGTPGLLQAGDLIDATAARMESIKGFRAKGHTPSRVKYEKGPRLVGDRDHVLFQPKTAGSFSERVATVGTMARSALEPMTIAAALQRYEYSFTDRALDILTRSLRSRPEGRPETYLHLGIAFGLQGDYDRAVDALLKAIAQSPDGHLPKAHSYLGRFLFESGTDYDRAVAELRVATQHDQTDPHSHFYLAHAIRAQVESQSRVEAAAAYSAYLSEGAPYGVDPELTSFMRPAEQEPSETRADLTGTPSDSTEPAPDDENVEGE